MARKRAADDVARTVHRLNQAAVRLYRKGRYQEALTNAKEARELARRGLGPNHPLHGRSLNNVATMHQAMGDHAAALPVFRQALLIYRATLAANDPELATCLTNLAASCRAIGDHTAAMSLTQEVLEIRRRASGEDHPDFAAALNNLAKSYREIGEHATALPLCRQAVEIHRRASGEAHPSYADSLSNLAMAYLETGDHAAVLPTCREALEVCRRALGEDHPSYAVALNSLANLHREMGDYAAALPLCRRALEIHSLALGEDHPSYAVALNSLAESYRAMGDHAAALPLYRRALESYRNSLGENHPNYATYLNNQAVSYREMGNAAAALPLSRQALEIRRRVLGENHPKTASSMNNLAMVYRGMGDYAAALPLCRQALESFRTALGESHPHVATALNNLAEVYRDMGDHAAALPLCRQALESYRRALGENHPRYAFSLGNLAILHVATGRAAEALTLVEQEASIIDQIIGQVLTIGSERQRLVYLATVLHSFYLFLSTVQQALGDSPAASRAALDLVLRRKAIAAEAMAAQRDAVLGGRHPALVPKLRELTALRMQIARKTLAGPGRDGIESHRRELAGWIARKERLEAELAGQIPEMNLQQKLRAADRRAVALSLPESAALVDFVRFRGLSFQAVAARGEPRARPARYLAFLLRAGAPDDVRMIDLGEAEPIDRLIADFRTGVIAEVAMKGSRDMMRPPEPIPPILARDVGSALRAAVFDRLTPALGGRTRLFIAPEGDLTRLPFEVLPTAEGCRVIDDYQISYVSCGRDVLRFGASATGRPGQSLVVADPDFDLETPIRPGPAPTGAGSSPLPIGRRVSVAATPMPLTIKVDYGTTVPGPGEPAMAMPSPSVPTLATIAQPAGRPSRDLERGRGAKGFHRLPGTRAEGERIANRLGVSPWLDTTALEGRLKAACHSPWILHLATHGFFLHDQQRDPNREGRGLDFDFGEFVGGPGGPGQLSGPMMENPMLRSGLALAGANTWLKAGNPPEEAEDGLLTAEDVTGLDLLATELVVLSACETGLGQVHVGEGVFGLRRAFVLAGAKTLVMSLWKVPDEPTRELMEDFYGRLLAGEGRAEALRQAQLAMKAKYPEPFYWGAFICQGDPSPLSRVESRPDRTDDRDD
jgi:tetratricopeptide (TPR) repeat protein